ncbi:hypothetical protein MMG00_05200 [Ignatzschineria rhizosphaerae]|uniref:Uncharacterized protein n=1 Tax=Ignatzschineria rhizosphaerae TaxID=2923279 RepID=A0ABY3X4Q6_9GAMM|nr:hypothetical protein [Ignatzschineria rhizosphaerae]UNM97250.1 hypothetical protein MMG00_05200 [Ignatzschineria rhizosphaerae]
MRKQFNIAIVLVLVCIGSSFAFANSSKIEQVFSYDMIGMDVTYLESIIGIARKTDTDYQTKDYLVDGCHLKVGYNGLSIESLTVDLTNQCHFNLRDIISYNAVVPSDKLVFGMTGPVTYYADCLLGCGNAYDPAVYELYQGPRAESFRELLLSSISDSYEARSKWTDTMIAKEGEEWVMNGYFNCDPYKYNNVAINALEGEKVDQITIGYNLESRKQLKFGCDEIQSSTNSATSPLPKSDPSVKEIPFQIAYQEADYTYFLGSQVVEGEILYEPNDMYGRSVFFIPDLASSQRLGIDANTFYFLNDYSDMNDEELKQANYYLDFNMNFDDPKFQNSYCTIKGKAKLQIIGISHYLPQESETYIYMRSLRNVESGPFRVSCE